MCARTLAATGLPPPPAGSGDHRKRGHGGWQRRDRCPGKNSAALGVKLSIDDFGTGYSSLSYLKRFPVDTLKVDRSFVDGLGHDAHDTAIVQSIVALAQTLGLDVTGEGIETEAQMAALRANSGVDRGQGYLIARPLAAGSRRITPHGAVTQRTDAQNRAGG